MPSSCYPNALKDDVDLNTILAALSLSPGAAQGPPDDSITGASEEGPSAEEPHEDDEYGANILPGDRESNFDAFWASMRIPRRSPSTYTSCFSSQFQAIPCNTPRSNLLCIFIIPI